MNVEGKETIAMYFHERCFIVRKTLQALQILTLLWMTSLFGGVAESRKEINLPRTCNHTDTWLRRRLSYVYHYESTLEAGFFGTSEVITGYFLMCDVTIKVPKRCEVTFKLSACEFKDIGLDGPMDTTERAKRLERELEEHELYAQVDRGQVLDQEIVVPEGEREYITNIKRAIVSQLQLPILPGPHYDRSVVQKDIFGDCPMAVTFDAMSSTVRTRRDLTLCQGLPQVSGRQNSGLSLVRQFQMQILQKPIDELTYPFASDVQCEYAIRSKGLQRSLCVHRQAFEPVTFDEQLLSTPAFNVTQSLTLVSVKKMSRREAVVRRSLEGRKVTRLTMHLEVPTADKTAQDVHQALNVILESYLQQADLPPERFQGLVDVLRQAGLEAQDEVVTTLMTYRRESHEPLPNVVDQQERRLVQSIRELFFADGLLSCGTEACMATYMKSVQNGIVGAVEGQAALVNIGLFYHPHPAAVRSMLTLCKAKASSSCWLAVGSLVGRLAQHVREDAVGTHEGGSLQHLQHGAEDAVSFAGRARDAIREVLQHLRTLLGEDCKSGALSQAPKAQQPAQLSKLVVALKALGNAGGAIQEFHDDTPARGKEIVPAVLQCLDNKELPSKVTNAAAMVIRKLDLEKKVHSALSALLSDASRPASLRTMAFDRLVRHEDAVTTRHLVDVIQKEKLQGLKVYMVTRLAHVLESNHLEYRSLRDIWRATLAENKTKLPEVEELRGRGSQYAEFSRYFIFPLTNNHHGGKLAVRVVYDPASVLPSNFRVSTSIFWSNRSYDLLELGLDLQGLENIARELFGQKGLDFQNGLGAFVAGVMQAVLPKRGEETPLLWLDKKVAEGLQKILRTINMPLGDFPQAELYIKAFGNEVGYVHLDDLIRLFTSPQVGSDGESLSIMGVAQLLSEDVHRLVSKAATLGEIIKVIPTLAGVPWRARVYGTVVASAMFHAAGNVRPFLMKKGPLEVTGSMSTRLVLMLSGAGSVQLGDVTASGLKVNVSVELNTQVESARLKFDRSSQPGAQVLELSAGVLKRPLHIASIRTNLYMAHNGKELAIQTPESRVKVNKCVPDAVRKWTGHNICLEGFHQRLDWSGDRPLPVLSGPVDLTLVAKPVDKKLKDYKVTFSLTRADDDPSGMVVVVMANATAPGDELNRTFDTLLAINPTTNAFRLHSAVPEFDLHYSMDYNVNATATSQSKLYRSQMSSVLVSFESKQEVVGKQTLSPGTGQAMIWNSSEVMIKFNVSLPGLSVEMFTQKSYGQEPELYILNAHLRYFCKPELGILYALHIRPDLAARKSHVTEWSFSNRAQLSDQSLAETWHASDTMVIILPGHNVIFENQMIVANTSSATRNTTVRWTTDQGTSQQKTDIIRMTAQVRNETVQSPGVLNYVMHMEHENNSDVIFQGKITYLLTDLNIKTDITFKAKPNRAKRSLQSFYDRLQRVEKDAVKAVETVEEMVYRSVGEITESFVQWLSGDPPPDQRMLSVQHPGIPVPEYELEVPNIGPVLQYFFRPAWSLQLNAKLKMKPKMEPGTLAPVQWDYSWNIDVALPDFQKSLVFFNGTLERGTGAKVGYSKWDGSTQWLMRSDILGLQLDYQLKQALLYPTIYHKNKWHFVDLNKHRMDRSFAFLIDLERQDHFVYNFNVTGPRTNLSHTISFNTKPELKVVRATMDVHSLDPPVTVVYREQSNLTPKRLDTRVTLNSTWLDLTLDMDIDFSKKGSISATKVINAFGKVFFLNGSRQLNSTLEMDMASKKRPPSLTIASRDPEGVVFTVSGQLLNPSHALFTFVSDKPDARKLKLLDWHIRLPEPTVLAHSFQWNPHLTEPMIQSLLRFYTAAAHSFRVFGQTVADNVYRNVTDMVIPFTNMTLSQAVDRVVQSQMKEVAMAGFDPKTTTPFKSKVLMGGLRLAQAIQTAWSNSPLGQLLSAVRFPEFVSQAAKQSTRLHYMLVKDPPFPVRQYLKHVILPGLRKRKEAAQVDFFVPLPFVWDYFLTSPRSRMFTRQMERRLSDEFSPSPYRFMAVLTPDRIHTFDGLSYSVAVPNAKCAYLLTTDLLVGNHSALLTRDGAQLALTEANVAFSRDGSVTISNKKNIIRDLPATLTNDRATVELKDGLVTVSIPDLLRLTYDPVTQIHVIETPAHAHNHSIGLLGTNTRDTGDDFPLPSGNITYDVKELQKQYEVSGHKACQTLPPATPQLKCSQKQTSLCEELFVSALSPLAPCFPFARPDNFMDSCLRFVCQEKGADAAARCGVVATYLKVCASRGHRLDIASLLAVSSCDCGTAGSSKRSFKVDLVFGSALGGRGELKAMISNVATHMEGDVRFGLVLDHQQHAHAHLFTNGQLLAAARDLKSSLSKSDLKVDGDSGKDKKKPVNVSVDSVIALASNFPFRRGSRRFIVLFTDDKTPDVNNVEEIQELLLKKDMSLVLVSSDLDQKRVTSVTWDLEVECQKCSKNKIEMPATGLGKLASLSRGLWMSSDAVHRGRNAKKLLKAFKHVAQQQSIKCQLHRPSPSQNKPQYRLSRLASPP